MLNLRYLSDLNEKMLMKQLVMSLELKGELRERGIDIENIIMNRGFKTIRSERRTLRTELWDIPTLREGEREWIHQESGREEANEINRKQVESHRRQIK